MTLPTAISTNPDALGLELRTVFTESDLNESIVNPIAVCRAETGSLATPIVLTLVVICAVNLVATIVLTDLRPCSTVTVADALQAFADFTTTVRVLPLIIRQPPHSKPSTVTKSSNTRSSFEPQPS